VWFWHAAAARLLAVALLLALTVYVSLLAQLAVPSTLRYAVHLLLNLVATPMLRTGAVQHLTRLAAYVLAGGAAGAAAGALGDVLWRWVSRLVACAQAHAVPPADVMQLLHNLVVAAPPWLMPRVAALDPFPEGEHFAALRAAHEAHSATVPLAERLSSFCERARGLPAGPRRVAAKALLAALRAPGAPAGALRNAGASSSGGGSTVAATVWRLAALCEQVDDDSLRELAAAALSVVGPPDPFAVAFHAPGAGASAQGAPSAGARRQSGAHATENDAIARIALRALAGYLVDADHRIVTTALQAARNLLHTDAGFKALDALEPLERSYLDVFAAPRGSARFDPAQLPVDTGAPLDDDALWAPPGQLHGRAYDAWLCKLTHALMRCVRGCTLRICRDLVARKTDLAAALLPYVFEDIAAGEGAGAGGAELRTLLSAKAEVHILRNAAAGARPTHALLECLSFLRAARVRAGLKGVPVNPGPHAAAALIDATSPLAWATVHWLDVDYLCVARAALRCGACFSVLQYVEYWCQEAHGELTLGSLDALNDAGALPAHVSVALEAHAMCAEQDGIYGILRTPHVALQLHRAEHEGAWGRSLAAHDAVLRIGGAGAPSAAAAAAGVLRALQHLGCPFVLNAAAGRLGGASGGAAGGSAVAPAFLEAQMEAAWRAGQWDLADASAPDARASAAVATGDGFHACLAGALRAMHEGEVMQCAGLLARGRAGVMRGIALTGAESAASINTAIVRLQLLDELSDAADARWSRVASITSLMLDDAAVDELSRRWGDTHTAHLGGRYDLLEPLLAGRAAIMNAANSAAGAAHALTASAAAARAAGFNGAGLARIHEIKLACAARAAAGAVAASAAAVGAPGAMWRDEEAALLWADGQYGLALGLARALVGTQRSETTLDGTMRRAALLSTLGGWLAERHDESASRIRTDNFEQAVALLTQARGATQQQPHASSAVDAALCSAHFQLAKFLDNLQRGCDLAPAPSVCALRACSACTC
jgi:hypothetical protein